jgi:dihydroorotate dehydrogenase electron transfer subunit
MSNSAASNTKCVCAANAIVVARDAICREHVTVTFELSTFPPSHPGQFVLIRCCDARASTCAVENRADPSRARHEGISTTRQPYLRRPFSIADREDLASGAVRLKVLSRNVGPGTTWLDELRVDDRLNLTGPLGRGFRFPALDAPIVLCGGGVGIPPLMYASRVLAEMGHPDVILIVGAMSADLLPVALRSPPTTDGSPALCARMFAGEPRPTIVTTDDGSLAMRGRVTDALEPILARTRGAVVLACGPEPMLAAVARLTRRMGAGCQLCVERFMACGFGACQSCVIRTLDDQSEAGWVWSQACRDGPVYDRDAVVDYQ